MYSLMVKYSRKGLVLAALGLLPGSLFAMVHVASAQGNTYKGEIMDEHCAKLGSHDATMKEQNLKAKDACVLYCAHFMQPNSKIVLYDAASKTIYQLDGQDMVVPFVGEMVQVTGSLNAATKTIKVSDIKVP